jgi:O-antigen/teichoic acid export membrane protein
MRFPPASFAHRAFRRLPPPFRSWFGDGLWLLSAKIVSSIATLGASALVARLLQPEELAIYLLAFGLSLALAQLATFGTQLTGMRFVAEGMALGDMPAVQRAVIASLLLGLGGAVLLAAAITLFPGPWLVELVGERRFWRADLFAISCWTATFGFRLILWGLFRGIEETRVGAWFDGAIGMSLTAAAFAFVLLQGKTLTLSSALWISVAAGGLATMVGLLVLAASMPRPARGEGAPDPAGLLEIGRTLMRVGLPIMASRFLLVATPQAVLWVMALMRPLDETADFAIALRLMLATSIIFVLSNQVLGPMMARMIVQGERAQLETFIRHATAIILIVCSLVALPLLVIPQTLIEIIFGKAYGGAAPALVVLTLAQLLQVFFGPAQLLLQMADRERGQMYLSLLALAANVSLAVPLSYFMGSLGAAIATALAIALHSGAATLLAHRSLGIVTLPRFSLPGRAFSA